MDRGRRLFRIASSMKANGSKTKSTAKVVGSSALGDLRWLEITREMDASERRSL